MNRNDSRFGSLPSYAPLAAAYVPMQENANDTYETSAALARGTLFPGLDLPFKNVVNDALPDSPLHELMAIDFVADELELYLDTHGDDVEAFAMYQTFPESVQRPGSAGRGALHLARRPLALGVSREKGGLRNVRL